MDDSASAASAASASEDERGSEDGEGRRRSRSKVKGKAEIKIYLFNDALLLATRRLGKPVCKYFLPLADVQLMVPGRGLPVCAIKFHHKGAEKCHAYKASSLEELHAFANAFRQEMYITLRTRLQPGDGDGDGGDDDEEIEV